MKIDLREFNGVVRDYLHGVGIKHFSTAVSYGGDRVKNIMIIPGAENEEVTNKDVGISPGQSMEQECDERPPV